MRERVDGLIGEGGSAVWVATFHSTCVRILRRHADLLGYTTGFSIYDSNRLGKPIVRFHEGEASAFPDAFQFNLAANDGYRLMRFPQTELDTNFGIKDNKEGTVPLPGDGGSLRDGVTD